MKIKYITKKEATEIFGDMRFCPAHYPHYLKRTKLINGEIGSLDNIRYIIKEGEK